MAVIAAVTVFAVGVVVLVYIADADDQELMSMTALNVLLVGAGGFLGSVMRYWVAVTMASWPVSAKFPVSTLLVNVSGCLLIGVLAGLSERQGWTSESLRLFIMVGVLGGFTTFSAFGLEAVGLLRRDELALALLYVGSSVVAGVLAVWLGMKIPGFSTAA